MNFRTVILLAALSGLPCAAQISMNRPGMTPAPKQRTAPKQSAAPATLTADEQKRLQAVIKHMKPKDRKRLAQALQKMTPQQRQQLLASVKQQLAKQPAQAAKRGW
jgi:hypothetical protein